MDIQPPVEITVIDWGRTQYTDALARQRVRVEQRRLGTVPDTLILTEHYPVYTLGARPGAEQHLLWTEELLRKEGIDVQRTNRGGDITYHGPGQIVGYPVISLQQSRDLHAYLRQLEELLIRTAAHFGLHARRREGKTGIWIEDRKLAAIGVAVKNWITYHGFALNVTTDLRHFQGIVPCGITDGTVTSIHAEGGAQPAIPEVKRVLSLEFEKIFRKVD